MKSQAGPELPNLDILRSFAVSLVVLSHTLMYSGKMAWCGWMGLTGVSMFFVHTCLVLMWSLERDPHTARFYVRRIFRIYPLWIFVLTVTVLMKLPISPVYAPEFRYFAAPLREVVHNALLTCNLFCANPQSATFDTGARIVGASWSLPVEMQMYLFLPFLFFFVRGAKQLWPLLLIDAFVIVYDWMNFSAGNTGLAAAVPYFLPGIMAYALTKKVTPRITAWAFPLFLLGFAALHHRYGTPRASWFFCLVLGLSLPMFQQVTWQPITRVAHLIARYSYGIYLCHIPALAVGAHYLHRFPMPVRMAGAALTLFVAPIALYHAIEKPMIRVGSRLAKRMEHGPEPRMDERNLSLEPAP